MTIGSLFTQFERQMFWNNWCQLTYYLFLPEKNPNIILVIIRTKDDVVLNQLPFIIIFSAAEVFYDVWTSAPIPINDSIYWCN